MTVKIIKLTKEKIAETEKKVQQTRIVKYKMIRDDNSEIDNFINKLRKDKFIEFVKEEDEK